MRVGPIERKQPSKISYQQRSKFRKNIEALKVGQGFVVDNIELYPCIRQRAYVIAERASYKRGKKIKLTTRKIDGGLEICRIQ